MSTDRSFNDKRPPVSSGHDAKGGGVFYATRPNRFRSAASLQRQTLYLGNLENIIDRVQELFNQWEVQEIFPASIRVDMIQRAWVVAHEWIARLLQEADFQGRVPQIALSVWVDQRGLCCLIADNSSGFRQAPGSDEEQAEVALRDIKWLMIEACVDKIDYHPLGNQGYGLEWCVS